MLLSQAGGGIFSDLSWLHLRPISSQIVTGYHQTTHCSLQGSEEDLLLKPLKSLENPNFEHFNRTLDTCYTSSLLVFRSTIHSLGTKAGSRHSAETSPSEIILQCILTKYGLENGAFRRCLLLEPSLTGGALCAQVTLSLSPPLLFLLFLSLISVTVIESIVRLLS